MAALRKTAEQAVASGPQPKVSTARIELATADSIPVDSAAHQLRRHLEAALAAPRPEASSDEPAIDKWPRAVRGAILVGAVVVPWSLIALAVQAVVGRRLLP
jgi:hypothetical protein